MARFSTCVLGACGEPGSGRDSEVSGGGGGGLPAPRGCVKVSLEKRAVKSEGQRGYMCTDGRFTVVVEQELTQHCKAIILQLTKKMRAKVGL